MYTPVKLNVFTDQHDKLKNAITHQKAASIKLNLDSGDGKHTLRLTRGQIAKIERAKLIGKGKVSIHLSKSQVQANVKHQSGFLGLAAKALHHLLKGLASGLVSGAVKKGMG